MTTIAKPDPCIRWVTTLEGKDPEALIRWLAHKVWPGCMPKRLVIDMQWRRPTSEWLEGLVANARKTASAFFDDQDDQALIAYQTGVVAARFDHQRNLDSIREWLEEAPFEIASFGTLHEDWSESNRPYIGPSFGRRHTDHGWGCAFKGAGHANLVSRRWLDFGPWRLLRGKNDLSLVLFHDLDAPSGVAFEQAKPGHKIMGISKEGGFLQDPYVFSTTLSGLYDPQLQLLRVVVLGRELSPVELLDACAARRQGALSVGRPLRQVAYVFPDPEEAQRNLHALWLRELECWTIIDGVEQRLDDSYHPVPTARAAAGGDE